MLSPFAPGAWPGTVVCVAFRPVEPRFCVWPALPGAPELPLPAMAAAKS